MSVVHLCDGCRKPTDVSVVVGIIVRREYCEACAVIAREFLQAEDALRVDLVTRFAETRNNMIAIASKDGFRLPDVL